MTGLRAAPWIPTAILSIFAALGPFAAGQDYIAPSSPGPGEPPGREILTYQIEWRLISAGSAKLTWTPAPRSAAAPSELRLHLESTGLVSRLFRVDDDYTAALGQNLCAQNSLIVAHEGNRNKETRVTYDAQTHKAIYVEKDLNKNSTISRDVDIPPCVHDVIGGLLVLRTLRLEPGKMVQIPVSDGKKFVQVKIESERREDLNTAMGPRKTIRYEIFLFDNVLYKRSGRMHIWLTDDNNRLPVQLQVRLQFTIGTITFKLEKEEKL
ncbi:MAG TPA: DUF3108 domain-containing protein [Bryobacteraceae bacterium]|jgi:hypothetical protein|nr:DUF3108 domain-containing protein [Bryobacteraceae bacterium]